jgi:DNA-binding NarL/FixJ family response regulator
MDKAQTNARRKRARILVVDDHAILREGLRKLIEAERDLAVWAEAENSARALQALEEQQFDLAIVDIGLEGTNGLELTERMRSRWPDMVVIILSMHDGSFYAQRALEAGAAGYVAKYEAAEKIITAIRRVLGGKTYVSDSRVRAKPGDAPVSDDSCNTNTSH